MVSYVLAGGRAGAVRRSPAATVRASAGGRTPVVVLAVVSLVAAGAGSASPHRAVVVVGAGAELGGQPPEVPRDAQREHVTPQDHEVAVDVVALPVVGLEHRQREEHRLADDEEQPPGRHHDHDRREDELREVDVGRSLAEEVLAVPHRAAQPVAGTQQTTGDDEDDAAAPRAAPARSLPSGLRRLAAPGPWRVLIHGRRRRPGRVRHRARAARCSTGCDVRSGQIAICGRRMVPPIAAKWSSLPFHHNSCIGPSLQERIGHVKSGKGSVRVTIDYSVTTRTTLRIFCCGARLTPTRIPASKTTKEIQAPLPGFGKLIANGLFTNTLSITLRDATDGTETDKWGVIVAHTPQPTPLSTHRTSSAPL